MSCTATIDGARYQRTIGGDSAARRVERGVDERVRVDVVLTADVPEVELVELLQEEPRLLVEGTQALVLPLVATLELADHQLRVRSDPEQAGRVGAGRAQRLDHRL